MPSGSRFTLVPTWTLAKITLALLVQALIATVLLERFFGLEPGKGFGEKGPVTYISTFLLIATGCLLFGVFAQRRKSLNVPFLHSPALVWAIMAVGFLYLAADEKFQFHENIDLEIHSVFGIEETPLTDRIDDVVIAVYGLIGCVVMYVYRKEVGARRGAWPYLLAGAVFYVATVTIDLLTNDSSLFPPALDAWISGLGEEGFKVLAEGMFLAAAYDCFLTTRFESAQKPHHATQQVCTSPSASE